MILSSFHPGFTERLSRGRPGRGRGWTWDVATARRSSLVSPVGSGSPFQAGQAAGTQLSPRRPTVQKRGQRGGGSRGPRETGLGARPAGSARPGCSSRPPKRVGYGTVHPSVEGSGCVHERRCAKSVSTLRRAGPFCLVIRPGPGPRLRQPETKAPEGPAFPTASTQRWSLRHEGGGRPPSQLSGCSPVSL